MERWFIVLALITCAVTSAYAAAPKEGEPAPPLALRDVAGNEVSLANLRGKVVVLNFWATWCKPCLAELPHLSALHERIKRDGGLVVAVSIDVERGKAIAMARHLALKLVVLLDPERRAVARYAPDRFPSTYLIDGAGVLRKVYSGALSKGAIEGVEERIRKLLPARSPRR